MLRPYGLLRMFARVVLGEDVLAEVAEGVAPDCMGVVGAVRGAGVLDEQPLALDAVVVGRAGLQAARPGEGGGVEALRLEERLAPGGGGVLPVAPAGARRGGGRARA